MLNVHLILSRVPVGGGQFTQHLVNKRGVHIDAGRIDTVTPIESDDERRSLGLPPGVNSVIRYIDMGAGFRLMFVGEDAVTIARARRREMHGEDSSTPDFGGAPYA